MKTLIIYTSQTGFTKKYADWLAQNTGGDLLDLKDAQKKNDAFFEDYEAIVYGGWVMAASVVKVKWFLNRAASWKGKKLAIYCVGGSPNDNPDVEVMLKNMLTDEQREYIKAFYCQGSALKKKKDPTEEEKIMTEMVAKSYDISDEKYLEPVIEYLT